MIPWIILCSIVTTVALLLLFALLREQESSRRERQAMLLRHFQHQQQREEDIRALVEALVWSENKQLVLRTKRPAAETKAPGWMESKPAEHFVRPITK